MNMRIFASVSSVLDGAKARVAQKRLLLIPTLPALELGQFILFES
jgi:hypothetical protein